jgi:membrane associated rhomboid family serine protease
MFMHGSFFHLFFNMFSLWMFGVDVELELGSTRFLKYYLFTGFSGGVLQVLLNWGDPTPVIGASAAVYGVLIAFSLLFPNRIVTLLLFFILPIQMKARTLAFIFVGISLLMGVQSTWTGTPDSVAHFAHLGGAVAGFLILRGSFYFQHTRESVSRLHQQHLLKKQKQKQDKIFEVRRRIDEILDRINEVGYPNISSEEKVYLKKAGEFLSKEDD